jgi:general secretion pathway protein K
MRNQKGIALILAMFTIVIVSYLATEIAYETNVEYLVNAAAVQHVKAYYAARAGVELSLLRIKIYGQVISQLPAQAKGMIKQDLLDMIWKMPFAWPLIIPDGATDIDKEDLNEKMKQSAMDASYMTTISDEGSKIDINALWSPTKQMSDLTHQLLLRIFQNKIRDDEKWARAHQDFNPVELVNNIQDWVSPGRQSINGGDKASRFSALGEGYPPNRGFRTVDEVRLVPGMTEDIFQLLQDQITVFGMRAINPNHATKEVLMSLDPTITSIIADDIIKRRDTASLGGPYKDANDFWGYVASQGARVDPNVQKMIPIICDTLYNFRIKSTGSYKNSTSEIVAITFDLTKSASQVYQSMSSQSQQGQQQTQTQQQTQQNNASKGPPRIVYWSER